MSPSDDPLKKLFPEVWQQIDEILERFYMELAKALGSFRVSPDVCDVDSLSKRTRKAIQWESNYTASEALVDPMIDDIGERNPVVVAASRKYATDTIKEFPDIKMGELEISIACFMEGYIACLQDQEEGGWK